MDKIEYNDLKKNLNFGNLKFYNIYHADLNNEIYYATQYYLKNKENENKEQKLHIFFIDIEVIHLKNFNTAEGEISSIVAYSNFDLQYNCYFFLKPEILTKFGIFENISQLEYQEIINKISASFKKDLLEKNYITENENININLFKNEQELLTNFCDDLKKKNPTILSGYFSDTFDWPYIYRRLVILFGEESAASMLSNFKYVELNNNLLKIPEYSICDLAHLYKPRGDGGLNYGKKQASYSLDFITKSELDLKKFEYKDQNINLDDFYYNDPINYLLYNLIDVALCVRLNQKFKHIELHNTIRRIMKSPFSKSMVGNSILFDSFILDILNQENKKIRYGINIEQQKSINKNDLTKILKPKHKKGYIEPVSITTNEYMSIVSKYDGAYVKENQNRIINDGSLIIDLDASLPPNEKIFIKRNNDFSWISIGSYNYQKNDKTLTWDKNGNTCWKKVLAKLEHNWDGKIVTITTENNKQITVTSNHSIFGTQKKFKNSEPYLLLADKLNLGDYVVGVKHFDINKKQNLENINLEKIINIKKKYYKGKVYDLSVKETERFFAGSGLGAHNSSLYPSMMLQHNISFDVYRARIIPTTTYKFLDLIKQTLGTETPSIISRNIFNIVEKYIDTEKLAKKEKSKKNIYYTIMYLIEGLYSAKIKIERIFKPEKDTESFLLLHYLLPLLDVINTIHPQKEVYNDFIYDYLFQPEILESKYKYIYILNNTHLPNQHILELNVNDAIKFINSFALTIAGTCFVKHHQKLGIFTDMLNNMSIMRKEYKNKLKDYNKDSKEYDFFNNRQLSIKVVMNTAYGVMGLSQFRYSNHWLAQSITASGRLNLKVAQHLTEEYLKNNY